MRQDLKNSFQSNDGYFEKQLELCCQTNIDFALALNTGHTQTMHTYKTPSEFLQKTVSRLCNSKENHPAVSVFADDALLQPILSEMVECYIHDISQWIQFDSGKEHKFVLDVDFGEETGFTVNRKMQVHSTTGVTLVFQKAEDYETEKSCPFGFYLATMYPSSDKKYLTRELGTLDRYDVLQSIQNVLPTTLEQVAFFYSGDHDDIHVKIIETKTHEKRVQLYHQDKNKYAHYIRIKENGEISYKCIAPDKSAAPQAYTQNIRANCPALYNMAINIQKALGEERDTLFFKNNQIKLTKGAIYNNAIISKIEDAKQEILNFYIEDGLLKIAPNIKTQADRFSITASQNGINKVEDPHTIQFSLTDLDDEISNSLNDIQQSQNINHLDKLQDNELDL